MNESQVDSLRTQFREWDFVDAGPEGWILSSAGKKAAANTSELVQAIQASDVKGDLQICIHGGSQTIIKVVNRAPKKYQRMYTSGCFDIFHFGHLNILERSKDLCEYLIVGVSTDELIEKEKGRRPVIPYEERARVLESISYVDQVIPQVDKNKQKIVDTYRIDAISVGDDWKGRYPAVSCQMEYFPYTKSISSTILKDTLKLTLNPRN
ncbi:adenylyltransferase/cytidyltransferase family protein [Robiginitalea sp. IMCC43444]|uniref:adenylyltransferase/cytidyltransferase family protein n=1 Tax=Robiginitalea sp. IMCC43444 TaxID=3459121 RepID=UPI0040426EAF